MWCIIQKTNHWPDSMVYVCVTYLSSEKCTIIGVLKFQKQAEAQPRFTAITSVVNCNFRSTFFKLPAIRAFQHNKRKNKYGIYFVGF